MGRALVLGAQLVHHARRRGGRPPANHGPPRMTTAQAPSLSEAHGRPAREAQAHHRGPVEPSAHPPARHALKRHPPAQRQGQERPDAAHGAQGLMPTRVPRWPAGWVQGGFHGTPSKSSSGEPPSRSQGGLRKEQPSTPTGIASSMAIGLSGPGPPNPLRIDEAPNLVKRAV